MSELEEVASRVREDFPILRRQVGGKDLVYLDSAATSHKPQCVIDAVSEFYASEYGTVHRAVYELAMHSTERYAAVRQKVARFLNAESENDIIFTRGTTEAINLVASSFSKAFIQAGDEVIVSTIDHHSNIVPWQIACEERGAILKVIPVDDRGALIMDEYAKLLGPKTAIVSVSHMANSLGTVNPIKQMAKMAHDAGARFLADGAQAAPHIPVDVQDLGVDFYAFSGHKIFAPTGVGCLYGKQELLEAMPPYQGGGDMIDQVSFAGTTYNDVPLKFEAGTPAIAQVIGLGVALDYVESIGIERIHAWESTLLARATERLQQIEGLRILGTTAGKGAIVSFLVDGVHHLDIGTMLDLKGIAIRTGHHCTMPAMERFGVPGTARASFAIYNTLAEVDHFADSLAAVLERLS